MLGRFALFLVVSIVAAGFPAMGLAQGGYSPHDLPFQVKIGGIVMDLDSKLQVDGRVLRGTKFDLEDDLGLTSQPVFPFLEVTYGGVFRANFAFLMSTRETRPEQVDQDAFYNGAVIGKAGDRLETRSEILTADFSLGSTVYFKPPVRIELILGAKYVHLKNRITNDNPADPSQVDTTSSTDTVDVPGLYFGFGGHILLSQVLTFYGRFVFTEYAWDVFETKHFFYTDFTLGLTYKLLPRLSVSVDYRLIRLEIVEDNSGHESNYDLFGNGIGIAGLWAF